MHLHDVQEKLKTPPIPGRKRAILVSTGSYCPIHKGHLENFDVVAKFLSEKCAIDSIVGYISPSSDSYVSHKLGHESIYYYHRYEMVKLACYEHNSHPNVLHVFPDPWEGLQPNFVHFPQVRQHFEDVMKQLFPKENLLVLYIAGADVFNKRKLYKQSNFIGVFRNGFKANGYAVPERNIFMCNDQEYYKLISDISSTQLRDLMKKGKSLNGYTFNSVITYIKDNL